MPEAPRSARSSAWMCARAACAFSVWHLAAAHLRFRQTRWPSFVHGLIRFRMASLGGDENGLIRQDGQIMGMPMRWLLSMSVLASAAGKLINASITPTLLREAETTLAGELDPQEDQQATAAMRRYLATVLLRRCVATLLARDELQAGVAK